MESAVFCMKYQDSWSNTRIIYFVKLILTISHFCNPVTFLSLVRDELCIFRLLRQNADVRS